MHVTLTTSVAGVTCQKANDELSPSLHVNFRKCLPQSKQQEVLQFGNLHVNCQRSSYY